MGRRKKNRYRLVSGGLSIEQSLDAEWCSPLTDNQIIQAMLINAGFYNVLESFKCGRREAVLKHVRVHQDV